MSLNYSNNTNNESAQVVLNHWLAEAMKVPTENLDPNADLIAQGLNSVQMMGIVGKLRKQKVKVKFADLLKQPSLNAWKTLPAIKGWLAQESQESQETQESQQNGEPKSTVTAVTSSQQVDPSAPFELATMQHAYWVGRQPKQYLGGVAAHFYHEFDGHNIDPERLEKALIALFERHPMLRSQISDDGLQKVLPLNETPWNGLVVHDLSSVSQAQAEQDLLDIRAKLSHRQLRINLGEVFDIQLTRLPDGQDKLHINLDMIAADAFSLRVLLADLAHLYLNPEEPLATLNYSYAQYQADRRALLAQLERQALKAEAQAHWQTRIPDMPGAPILPTAPTALTNGIDTNRVVRRHCDLSSQQKQRLTEHASQHGITVSMALASVLAEVLTGFSENADFLLNLPLFDRESLHPEVNSLVGDFTSSILLQWQGSLAGGFVERARALQQRFHQDVAHASFTGVEVLRDMGRYHGETVYAPVVFTSALGIGELFGESVRNAFGDVGYIISQGPQVWLDVQVMELKDGLSVNWDAREAAFAPGVLDAMFAAFVRLIDSLIDNSDNWQNSAPAMLTDEQKQQRARVNNDTQSFFPQQLHQGFFQQAAEQPERTALIFQDQDGQSQSISYGQLASDALRVAAHLQAQGVEAGDVVGILLPKGPEQITAVLATLALRAAYLPLGIDAPELRRERIINKASVKYVLDDVAACLGEETLAQPLVGEPEELAYIIFTSGSTGEPKGVEISHMAAWNTIADINRRFDVSANDKVLAVSALDFDLSVYDIFGLLSVGGALVLVAESERRDAERWQQLVKQHQVTLWNTVPALLDMVLTMAEACNKEGSDEMPLASLRLVFNSGDWIGLDLPQRLQAQCPNKRFIAMGGATEASIWSNHFEVETLDAAWHSIPYGFPLANQKFRVVDVHGRDCPDWVSGELWIGGAGVALGYRGAPDLTAQRFVEVDGERWYRTGDMGRYWPDACLEFLGRQDNQVKVRGHRIELGEIEAALLAYEPIAQAVVLLHERAVAGVVILAEGYEQTPQPLAGLSDFLSQRLTAAMTPSEICVVERFPLTANGKLDRGELHKVLGNQIAHSAHSAGQASCAPQTEVEQRVAKVWQQFLNLSQIDREANFFTLGGDSLLATRIVRHLRDEGLSGVTLAGLFSAANLAEFADKLQLSEQGSESDKVSSAQIILEPFKSGTEDLAARHLPFEPTEVQRAYWLGRDANFELGGIGCHFYREYDVVDLDLPRLEQALNLLITRHEMLRAVFDENGQQRILATVPHYQIALEDMSVESLRDKCSQQVFEPSTWPLFDIRAVRNGATTRLAIGLDNLILDAFSILLFYRELNLLYQQADTALPAIELSFRDYVCKVMPQTATVYNEQDDSIHHQAAQTYWQQKLAQLPPAPQLPTACEPADIDTPHFVRHQAQLSQDQWQHLVNRAAKQGITPSCLLLTAFAEVLSRWSARPDLSLNLTLFDRREVHPDIYRVMGDFTSLTLVGYQPQKSDSWQTRAKQIQGEVGAALEHRNISSISLMRELARRQPDANTTMPVVFTSALGIPGGTAAPADGPLQTPVWALTQTPQVWLDHQVVEVDGGVLLNWDVVEALFPQGMCAEMFQAYISLLQWAGKSDWQDLPPDLMPETQYKVRRRINYPQSASLVDNRLDHSEFYNLSQPFFEKAKASPNNTALIFGDSQISYLELANQALSIANWLLQQQVENAEVVAVSLAKGPLQIAAVLGVLAAGAAYVPVSIDQPQARRDSMLARAEVKVVLDANSIEAALNCDPNCDRLSTPVVTSPEQLAYIIFTSGSTGVPKGVEISHRAAFNTINDINQRYNVDEHDKVLAISALEFDLSVYDIFGLLAVGGALVLIDESERRDSERWQALLAQHDVTIWNTVPALLDMLLTSSRNEVKGKLRVVMNSGDWIGLSLPDRLHQAYPQCRFIAMGGATEASIWSNHFEVEQVDAAWRSIPYGFPLSQQRFRVIDSQGRDCPDWVTGELWIGGDGVAMGYTGAPELTAERFVNDSGERWYRTGDMGRYWPNGCLEFLGRADTQVKLRGHRIELGEIEAALLAYESVNQVTALLSDNQIVGVVVTQDSQSIDEAALLDEALSQQLLTHLEQQLPHYMLPDLLVALPAIPLSSNGKVDRKAITKAIDSVKQNVKVTLQLPQTEQEQKVAALWQSLLSQPVVYREQSFFALGGDSLLATRFIDRLQQQHGLTVPLQQLFAAPDLTRVAASLIPVAVPAFTPFDDDSDMEEGAI